MKLRSFENYSMLYESKLAECDFLKEQNITAQDIIQPIEGLITEELIGQWLKDKWQKGKQVVKDVYQNVKTAVANFFSKVVDFFKNFSLSKLTSAIFSKIKEIGTKAFNSIKEGLSGFKEFILQNGFVGEDNSINFKQIWKVLCEKSKNLINWKEEGISPDEISKAGDKVSINESKFDIGEDEVKYYGFFEKVFHALGIKNARANGVVSQIVKKGTIGLIIMGIIKISGLSLAGLGIAALGPVALACIGGMLLMAGLIILAIWVCKPYPTVDDCLAYLHIAYSNKLADLNLVTIFTTVEIETIDGPEGDSVPEITDTAVEEAKPIKSMYPTMIKNLKALQSMLISFEGVEIETGAGQGSGKSEPNKVGKDKKVKKTKLAESISSFAVFEKEFSKQPRSVKITAQEEYLVQAFKNISKLIDSTKNEKDKGVGITEKFLEDVLSKKQDSEAKEVIKSLYTDVYDHLYGKYAKTIQDFGPLYKESIQILSEANKRKVVAEKIARLSKRTMQFEGENMYAALGEFGADMEEFNTTLKEIMTSVKADMTSNEGLKIKRISSYIK